MGFLFVWLAAPELPLFFPSRRHSSETGEATQLHAIRGRAVLIWLSRHDIHQTAKVHFISGALGQMGSHQRGARAVSPRLAINPTRPSE